MAVRPSPRPAHPIISPLTDRHPAEPGPGSSTGGEGPSLSWGLRLASRIKHLRGRHLLVLDTIGMVFATTVALAVRYDPISALDSFMGVFPGLLLVMLLVRTSVNVAMGLYSRDWRHSSVGEAQRIAAAALIGSLILAAIVWISAMLESTGLVESRVTEWVPRGYWPLELLLVMAVLGGSRFMIRISTDHLSASAARHAVTSESAARTLIYGAGAVGVLMARSAQRNPRAGVLPVGFLDDDARLHGTRVVGLRVLGGLDQMEAAVAASGAKALVIAMPSAPGAAIRRVVDQAMTLGLTVRTVPALEHLMDGTVDAYRVRRVKVEDLLRRDSTRIHPAAVTELFRDRVVLVTGAAGSIGSELARQVHAMGPRRLILLDRAESPLYLVQRDLEERSQLGEGSGEIVIRLGNVVNRTAMGRLVSTERPDVILHAAAYKHVPMLEDHPSDAVHVNVAGTMSVLDAAAAAGVERFVLVSTDKAVKPSSVMGASKRIAEMLVLDTARRTGRPYVAVRFGNVLGSAGSVVPIFQEQLESGRPLTITHPEMTRFFMTIPEAAGLILDAAALGRTGDLFVLDMGDPVKVLELAKDVTRLAGRDPETQPIKIVGLRPGEKLHEELFYADERVDLTEIPKVMRAHVEPPTAEIREQVRTLISLADGEQEPRLAQLVHACARGEVVSTAPSTGAAADVRPMVPVMGAPVDRDHVPTAHTR